MTVEELREVLADQFETHEKHEDAQHAEIVRHFYKLNGKVATHDKDIRGLLVRDAFWAGGAVALCWILKLIFT